MKRLLIPSLCVGLAFAYGYLCHRHRLFPFELIQSVKSAVGGEAPPPPPPDPRPGMWQRARDAAARGEEPDMGAVRDLAALGYMAGMEPVTDGDSGVRGWASEAAFNGWNLVVSGHAVEASLIDMEGAVRHVWAPDLRAVWPEADPAELRGHETFWRRAHVFPDGELLAIFDRIGMVRVDAESRVLWTNLGGMHHDLDVDEQGNIWTLARRRRTEHGRLTLEGPIEEDLIVVLTPGGEELSRVSVLDAFLDSDYYAVLSLADREGDLLHTNTIELMDGRFAGRHRMFERGNVLVSCPTVNTIAVIDPDGGREGGPTVVWALTGLFQFQHQPTVLDSGNLLVFDNLGQQGRSKVIELDPFTQEVLWAYRDGPTTPLSSYFLGSCQRLPNGNTLITESAAGRALEVNAEGLIVWEYLSPERAGEEKELIACLMEVVRLAPDYFEGAFGDRL